jgi:hypothetical protein
MDGAFIAIAVGLVTGIGASVDYKKEVAFVDKRNNTENGKRVSNISSSLYDRVFQHSFFHSFLFELATRFKFYRPILNQFQ